MHKKIVRRNGSDQASSFCSVLQSSSFVFDPHPHFLSVLQKANANNAQNPSRQDM